MKNIKKKYFLKLSNELSKSTESDVKKLKVPKHLMASQYSWVHNLKTYKLEDLRRIKKVLGYNENDFTLEFYFSKIHPDDKNIIFEASRIAINYINEYKLFDPELCQLTLLYRILKSDNQYAHIQRQSVVYEVFNNKIHKTFSLCNNVTALNLKCPCSVYFTAPGFAINENFHIVNKNKLCLNKLSIREKNIVMLLSAGYDTKTISQKLNLSVSTIYTHRRNILKKTGMKNMVEVINEYK